MGGSSTVIRDYPGTHVAQVKRLDHGLTPFKKQERVTVDLEILSSTNPDLQKAIDAGTARVPDMIFKNQYADYFYSDLRKILGALVDHDASDDNRDWDQDFEAAKAGKYAGKMVAVTVYGTGKTIKHGPRAGKEVYNATYETANAG